MTSFIQILIEYLFMLANDSSLEDGKSMIATMPEESKMCPEHNTENLSGGSIDWSIRT